MEKAIIHNECDSRFEMLIEDSAAYIYYRIFDGKLEVLSTRVPPALEGQGIAGNLTKHVLEYARNNNLKVIPTCSYTEVYLKRHPEYQDLKV